MTSTKIDELSIIASLRLVKNYSTKKIFKLIKIFDGAFKDEDKQAFLKRDLDKDESEYEMTTFRFESNIYTALFEPNEDQSAVYYNDDLRTCASVIMEFINSDELDVEFVKINRDDFNNKDFKSLDKHQLENLKEAEQYRLDDISHVVKKAKDDIDGSRKTYLEIKEKIESLNEEWQYFEVEFEYKDKKHIVKVPKLAFIFYALDVRYAMDTLDNYDIPNWECIAASGWKCQGDNPYHTDFWIGCGFTFESAYPTDLFDADDNFYSALNEELYELKYEIQSKYWNFTSNSIGSKKKASGYVMHYDNFKDDFSKIKPDSILILPHLGMEYEEAIFEAMKNGKGGVIAEQGGRTSHISIMGREMEFPIFIEPNALEKYRWIKRVVLDGINKKIKVTPF